MSNTHGDPAAAAPSVSDNGVLLQPLSPLPMRSSSGRLPLAALLGVLAETRQRLGTPAALSTRNNGHPGATARRLQSAPLALLLSTPPIGSRE